MPEISENYLDNSIDKKTSTALNIFWTGFIIYTLSWTVTTTSYVNFILFQSLQIVAVFLFVPAAIYLISWKIENKFVSITFILYCCWIMTVLIRGFVFEYVFIKYQIIDAYDGIFVYFVPLVLLFPITLQHLKKIFTIIIIFGVSYLIFDLLFIKDLLYRYGTNLTSQAIVEYFSKSLSIPCGFLLLTFIYHSNKRKLFALALIIMTFLFAMIRARRGLMFMTICILMISYLFYFFSNKGILINILFSTLLISFLVVYGNNVYNQNSSGLFNFFKERKNEDTRTLVEDYFYRDMTTKDWIIGKGIYGSYYCPGIDGPFTVYRTGIETDYLSIILKGGIISLGLQLLIIIPAIFAGLFRSKNLLSKAAGIWILLYISDMYPAPVTDFTLNYILVWICVGICYSEKIRNLPDSVIKNVIYK
jgi:hypothetical protein